MNELQAVSLKLFDNQQYEFYVQQVASPEGTGGTPQKPGKIAKIWEQPTPQPAIF